MLRSIPLLSFFGSPIVATRETDLRPALEIAHLEAAIQDATVALFLNPDTSEQGQTKEINVVLNVEEGTDEQRWIIQWLLHCMSKGEDREQSLEKLLPHCERFMQTDQSPRAYLAGGDLLYEAFRLPEHVEHRLLLLAQACLRQKFVDVSLMVLTYQTVCQFSEKPEELLKILREPEGKSTLLYVQLASRAIMRLPPADSLTIAQEVFNRFCIPEVERNHTDRIVVHAIHV